jgi:molecular chaperone GrpE (heat shock protein)
MEGRMSEGNAEEKSISSELARLGKQVADAISQAWESEDRRKLQAEVTVGLETFGDQVSDAMRKASESDAANQLRDETEKVVARVRESDVTAEVRKGLISGLEVINRELGKLVERLEVEPQPSTPPAAESAEPVEPPESATSQAAPPAPSDEV